MPIFVYPIDNSQTKAIEELTKITNRVVGELLHTLLEENKLINTNLAEVIDADLREK